jgi:hypothetical protein
LRPGLMTPAMASAAAARSPASAARRRHTVR